MSEIIKLEPSDDFKLLIEYSDGLSGEISFTKMLQREEYSQLNDIDEFKKIYVDENTNDIAWSCGVTMCKNATRSMLELKQEIKNLKLPL